MRTIETVNGQSIYDIAVQEYGNVEASFLIVEDNGLDDIDLSASLPVRPLEIRENDDAIRLTELNKLNGQKVISE